MQGKQPFNTHHQNEKTIVHPPRNRYVHTSSESVVNHIHPVHTTYINHHVIKNHHTPFGMPQQPFLDRRHTGRPFQSPLGPLIQRNAGRIRHYPGRHPLGGPRPW